MGLVMLEVGANGAVPIDFVVARAAGAGGFVQAAEDGLAGGLLEFAAEFVDDFLDDGAGGVFGFGGEDVFEGEECGDEVNVGLDGLEEFGFETTFA